MCSWWGSLLTHRPVLDAGSKVGPLWSRCLAFPDQESSMPLPSLQLEKSGCSLRYPSAPKTVLVARCFAETGQECVVSRVWKSNNRSSMSIRFVLPHKMQLKEACPGPTASYWAG